MKVYGKKLLSDNPALLEEVVFQIGAAEARNLASFLIECAQEMESDDLWEHRHLSDWEKRNEELTNCDLIVFRL
ncbi:hypothetical protein C1925_19875 [Stenotrophomonas sp. SAU14A_NAIMI4_5]|uniref:Imm32 family immunity protein n=1 Tax=Stenotrophomonas sp. SAU14A_NAIMI4_5 TaxID=2072413 RepID=UPI000D5404CE|nr:hypothetical protein [Stenotrophomonas sp. SAU14A_NAIMI4_5]AWH51262.1 hypothetical protein C1925_19875 [Stenotrophomonas sp. SAU14A_NAIMI4_5]